jgi:hypothetical protein
VQVVGDTLGDAKDWVGGLFSGGKSKPSDNIVNGTKIGELDMSRGGPSMFSSTPGGKGPFDWMKWPLYIGASAAALKYSGVMDIMCRPPKESADMK